MKQETIFRNLLPFLLLPALLFSCVNFSNGEFAPYRGYEWAAPYKNDSLILKLTTASDVVLSLKSGGAVPGAGQYETHRKKFLFSDFSMELNGVQYCLYYATYDKELNMVVYGDSLNAECDTAFLVWSKHFSPVSCHPGAHR